MIMSTLQFAKKKTKSYTNWLTVLFDIFLLFCIFKMCCNDHALFLIIIIISNKRCFETCPAMCGRWPKQSHDCCVIKWGKKCYPLKRRLVHVCASHTENSVFTSGKWRWQDLLHLAHRNVMRMQFTWQSFRI